MLAPSFQTGYTLITEMPFFKNGKNYVIIKSNKTGNERTVRWYSDREYAKAYGKTHPVIMPNKYGGLKAARGFSKGPILVITNVKSKSDIEWVEQSPARYACGVGWYFASTETELPQIPKNFKLILLGWNEIRDEDDEHIKSNSEVSKIIADKVHNKEFFVLEDK